MPPRLLASDQQRQLERLGEAYPAYLLGRCLGDDQVSVLERSAENDTGVYDARPECPRKSAGSRPARRR
jgi:hypothetical protein